MTPNGTETTREGDDTDEEAVVGLSRVFGEAAPVCPCATSHDGLPPAEAWDAFEGLLWSHALAWTRQEVTDALAECEEAVRDGRRPTGEQIRTARHALEQGEALVDRYEAVATEAP